MIVMHNTIEYHIMIAVHLPVTGGQRKQFDLKKQEAVSLTIE